MDIDRIIEDLAKEVIQENKGSEAQESILTIPKKDLYKFLGCQNLKNEEVKAQVYRRFKEDTQTYINDFLLSCEDANADKGMYKCSLETWKACANYIGIEYFKTYKLNRNYKRESAEGGNRLDDDLIEIGLTIYEDYCNIDRQQFFIYDSCKFLGIDLDNMYMLNKLHTRYLKKAHSIQEDSMRTALASGRSNVTAMAILLNHDYDYTRTTQVIHTSNNGQISAVDLPRLEDIQDIDVIEGKKQNQIETEL